MRDRELHSVQIEAEDHPTRTIGRQDQRYVIIQDPLVEHEGHLRYAGTLGDVDVEVRGMSDVGVYKGDRELRVKIGDVTVRLSLRDE
jgi:hypothetical protein